MGLGETKQRMYGNCFHLKKIQKNKTHNPHAPFNLNIEVLLNTHLSYAQTTGSEKEESGEET